MTEVRRRLQPRNGLSHQQAPAIEVERLLRVVQVRSEAIETSSSMEGEDDQRRFEQRRSSRFIATNGVVDELRAIAAAAAAAAVSDSACSNEEQALRSNKDKETGLKYRPGIEKCHGH